MKKDLSPAVSDISAYPMTLAELAAISASIEPSIEISRLANREAARASGSAADGCPPIDNMGGKHQLVLRDGKIVEVLFRRGWGGDAAFLDWVNFTCHESSFWWENQPVTDDQVIVEVSRTLEAIFGFAIFAKRDKGANFYRDSYEVGNGIDRLGLVCHGGQRGTVLVSISGSGLMAAKQGWELRLYEFLKRKATSPRITRVDLAHDDFEGERSVEWLEEQYDAGGFNSGGRMPDCEKRGNWKYKADGELMSKKGRTFYVGHRENGKFFRGYEKGRQLGDANSPWLRFECEFKSVDRDIPFDVLLQPGAYMAASYPCLMFISKTQQRIRTTKKALEISYENMKAWLKKQCGAALWVATQIDGLEVLKELVREGDIPKRLNVPDWKTGVGQYVHNSEKEFLPLAVQIEQAFV